MNTIKELLENCYNLILTGAPGTGKTYLARQIAEMMVLGRIHDDEHPLTEEEKVKRSKQVGFCQFHPSYDYTDFVEGLRPIDKGNEAIGFQRQDGIFKKFCKAALDKPNDKFVFIIDEINRGDIAKIFGELFFAIDPGYRGSQAQEWRIKTQYDNLIPQNDVFKEGFYVPDNVYIIGTMNDIDRNVESMDFAIRRRFTWREIKPEETLSMWDNEKTGIPTECKERAHVVMTAINNAIKDEKNRLGDQYQLGAAYFMKLRDYDGDFKKLWDWHIAPLLHEYLRGMPEHGKHFDDLKRIWDESLNAQQESNAEETEPPAQEQDTPTA